MADMLKRTQWVGVRLTREEKGLVRRAARRIGIRRRERMTMSEYMRDVAVAAARAEVAGNGQTPSSQDVG